MLALRIALRYLFARKSHKAVNVISIIAVCGVAVATTAIVVVLSVFNGFTQLSQKHLSLLDPELRAEAVRGKVFGAADSLCAVLEAMPEVEAAMPALEERALAVFAGRQMPVLMLGVVPEEYPGIVPVGSTIIDGFYADGPLPDGLPPGATVCVNVANTLGSRPGFYQAVDLYTPRRRGRINPANPAGAYRSAQATVTGVFRVGQPEYDTDYIITDIALLRRLLDYRPDQAGAIEIRLAQGVSANRAAEAVQAALGSEFSVLTRERQHAESFRMIAVEKWVTFLMMVFILVIASFNIISTLSLLVIEKRDNMATLRALGAPRGLVAAVFAWEGTLITALGGLAGIVLGVALSLVQEHFGLIKLGADPTALTIDVYPVEVLSADILVVAAIILILGAAIGQISRLFTDKIR